MHSRAPAVIAVLAGAVAACGGARDVAVRSDAASCTRCHEAGSGAESAHLGALGLDACAQCHPDPHGGSTVHKDGRLQVAFGGRAPAVDGSPGDACVACHTGRGETLTGRTPSPLLGWFDAAGGDWHGARAGTGSGGTLKAPYVRGQEPLPCRACHDAHASGNVFLLRATVNGRAIPAGAIDRAGVGAEALCDACHEGERHASCLRCHGGLDPDPAGKPCFWCHGHEGIVRWYPPVPEASGCCGCHALYQRAPESTPPVITNGPTIRDVTPSGATVEWTTNEPATSWVEYGVSTARHASGDGVTIRPTHVVTLTGLAPSTTYVWRVRTSDEFRNVAWSAPRTFTTLAPEGVQVPEISRAVVTYVTLGATTTTAVLVWEPATAFAGGAVEYEVQVAADPGFTVAANAALTRVDGSLATGNSGWIPGTPWSGGPQLSFPVTLTNLLQDPCSEPPPAAWTWFRVRARDAHLSVSEWSAPSSFVAMAWDPDCQY